MRDSQRELFYDDIAYVIQNTKPSSHRFGNTTFQMSKFGYFSCVYPDGGVPLDDLRKIFSECQSMAKVPNGIEILA